MSQLNLPTQQLLVLQDSNFSRLINKIREKWFLGSPVLEQFKYSVLYRTVLSLLVKVEVHTAAEYNPSSKLAFSFQLNRDYCIISFTFLNSYVVCR